MKLREPRIGGRHYRLHPLDTTEGVNSAHALTLSIIEGRRITRISREKIKTSFTFNNIAAYTAPVAAKSAAGFDSPKQLESTPHLPSSSAVFLCSVHGRPLYGRAVREAFGLAGPVAGLSTRTVPSTLIDSRVTVQKTANWSINHA